MDATHNTEDADAKDRLRWRGLREQLVERGAPDHVLTHLDHAVENAETPEGTSSSAATARRRDGPGTAGWASISGEMCNTRRRGYPRP